MVSPVTEYKYEEIADEITRSLQKGEIAPGSKLPSLRVMAGRYSCSLSVVMQAYAMLEARGSIYAVEKSGYFADQQDVSPMPSPQKEHFSLQSGIARPVSIMGRIVEASNDNTILPLGAGVPDSSYLPIGSLKKEMNQLMIRNPRSLVDYTDELGDPELRDEISRMMRQRGISAEKDEILLTNGCSEALSLAVQSCSAPGDIIALESPVFPGIIQILKELKRRIITIPTSPETGMDLEKLEEVLDKEEVQAVVITALYQNPLGFVMPEEARVHAMDLAEKYKTTIIEDDIYHDCSFVPGREKPLKSFDTAGRVIYCCSFSKTLAPAFRIGWLTGGNHHRKCRNLKMAQTLGGSGLLQKALAGYLKSPRYLKHLVQLQKTMARQAIEMRTLIKEHFPSGTAVSRPRGGYYLWIQLPEKTNCLELFEQALVNGISTVPGQAFSPEDRYGNCLRITFAAPITPEIRMGIRRLAELIKMV